MPLIVNVTEDTYLRINKWVRPPGVERTQYVHVGGEEFRMTESGSVVPSQEFAAQKSAIAGDRLLVVEWVNKARADDKEHIFYVCRNQEHRDTIYNALLAVMDLSTSNVRTEW